MHIPFPYEAIKKGVMDYKSAGSIAKTLEVMTPKLVRQVWYYRIAYPIMWASFLAISCFYSSVFAWWHGYIFLVVLALSSHVLFYIVCVYLMKRVCDAEKMVAYITCYYIRTLIVCVFAGLALLSLGSSYCIYRTMLSLASEPNQPAAVESTEDLSEAGATNVNATAETPTDQTTSGL